jgi:hypothetical protein
VSGPPYFNEGGSVIGACSISGADSEMVRGRLSELSLRIMNAAQEISRLMGYVAARSSLVTAPLPFDSARGGLMLPEESPSRQSSWNR